MKPDVDEVLNAGLLAGCGKQGAKKEKNNSSIRYRCTITNGNSIQN